jgi:uncharacterized protein (DUF1800 family)
MLQTGDMPSPQRSLHLLNRMTFGPRPGDLEHVNRIGVENYLQEQLHPEEIPEPPGLVAQIAAIRTLHMTPIELFEEFQLPVQRLDKRDIEGRRAARRRSRIVVDEAIHARIIRAIYGPRQLQEVMTAFWFNHFNVFAGKGLCHLWVGAYEQEAIRPHTMGRFRDLLGATAKHPAMLFYLDNWQNTAPESAGRRRKFRGINENYAREVMELHTLGVNGGYSQQDVIALAHILTGWTFARRNRPGNDRSHPRRFPGLRRFSGGSFGHNPLMREAVRDQYGFFFDPRRHDFASQTFLHRRLSGAGIEEGEHALDMLASSPATAHHLSYQLAQYFVTDNPPQSLIAKMVHRYQDTSGDIRAVLETMFTSPEFWDRRNCANKFKTPYQFVISAGRALAAEIRNVRPLAGAMAQLGQPLYGCQTPDGYKNTQEAWLNPDAMMMRLSFATALGSGHLPLARSPFQFDEGRMDGTGGMARTVVDEPRGRGVATEPPDPARLVRTLGDSFSVRTRDAVSAAPPHLRAAMLLGSPEFMMR